MSDNTREMISALLDDEASEIEIHRIVRKLEADQQLTSSLLAWQQIRSVAKNDVLLSRQVHVQLLQRIRTGLDEEPELEEEKVLHLSRQHFVKPLVGLASAASLVLAFVVGLSYDSLFTGDPVLDASIENASVENSSLERSLADTETVSSGAVGLSARQSIRQQTVSFGENGPEELVELDEEKRKMVAEYLRQHERMTQLNSDVRVVTFEQNDNKSP